MLLPQVTPMCAQNIYVVPQVTLVCAQNIYVATTGDTGVCAEHLQTILPCCHAAVGYHLQSQYLTAVDDTDVHFVLLAYTVDRPFK